MDLFTLENLMTLLMLTMLQAVLGFDNLLYVSLESKRAPAHQQAMVRKLGIGLAVALRIILLLLVMKMIGYFTTPMFALDYTGVIEGVFNFHAVIVLLGGAFILYTASKEVLHMMVLEEEGKATRKPQSVVKIITLIVAMNLVFSFDSILSAIALSDVYAVMATSIIIGGILMIWLAERVSEFLERNRMFEVLGLFILFIVGVMLVTEGGHLAHLHLFGKPVVAMTKTTFYFVIGILVVTEVVQSRYRKKLQLMKRNSELMASEEST